MGGYGLITKGRRDSQQLERETEGEEQRVSERETEGDREMKESERGRDREKKREV